jgi:hypothetical protein
VANSLDSGASQIVISADPTAGALTVSDDGKGMTRAALRRYHDLASTSKRRGRTIGFAGVGIKLALLIAEEVVTETRRAKGHFATSWRLSSRSRAPWRWIEPPGRQREEGTTVRIYLRNSLSPLLEPGFVDATLIRHFHTLLDPDFGGLLAATYPRGVRFFVNGRPVERFAPEPDRVAVRVKVGRQRKPSGTGYLIRRDDLAEDERGIAISTLGKVIKRGWDWLGLAPAEADRVTGLFEVPALVEALTLNKADFVRTGPKGATFLSYRKAIQEVVAAQLQEWGASQRPADGRPRRTRALERDLRSVLADLTDEYPILTTLVEPRRGGQQKLALGEDRPGAGVAGGLASGAGAVAEADGAESDTATESDAATAAGAGTESGEATGVGATSAESVEPHGDPASSEDPERLEASVTPVRRKGPKRPAHLGLKVAFESRPEDPELGALVESTVLVNIAHPAYRRAAASRSEGYHVALTVAMTLAPLAVEARDVQGFVTTFLAAWGGGGRNGQR